MTTEDAPDADDTCAAAPAAQVSELGTLDQATAQALTAYRQGDVLEGPTAVHVVGPDGNQVAVPAPLGTVLVSQTCDVVQSGRAAVQVARRIRLPEAMARDARDGKRPRFAHLPQIGERDFADLDVMGTVAKSRIAAMRRSAGVATDEEVRRFAGAVARKFGRFAFPDKVTAWLRPLEEVATSKTRRPNSPEGRAFAQVVELRVEAPGGWGSTPHDLRLCVIVQPGELPTFPGDELPDLPDDLNGWLYDENGALIRSSGVIAERLDRSADPAERYWLWMALGEAWGQRCRPSGNAPADVLAAVSVLEVDVVPADEFPLSRVRRSEVLDLDHLSAPTPQLA